MASRNLYVTPENESVWQDALALANAQGLSLSMLVTVALSIHIERERTALTMECQHCGKPFDHIRHRWLCPHCKTKNTCCEYLKDSING